MFSLGGFYDYCKTENIDIMLYPNAPTPGATMRDNANGYYCVSLDFTQIPTTRMLRTVAMHEEGHLRTGALHKLHSPFQLSAQSEQRADAKYFQLHLSAEEIKAAMQAGYTESWQLAEYFDLDEKYIRKALSYWEECRDVHFDTTDKD